MHGTTRMRTQVELDPGIGMRGFDAVKSLIDDYKWAIDVEICVFPQEGLTNYPGTEELLVEGLKRGAKVIGGAPRYDSDHAGQIERIFALAREFDVDIDMHLDVGNTPDAMDIHLVRDLTQKYKWGGRVVVGHMAKLSLLPPDQVATIARQLADAGIAVTVLPATDLFLMGRDQEHNVRRGVTDANLLLEHGVNCSLSSNNILNPATPYGDCSLIRMANLYANVVQLDRAAQLHECFRMLTDRSASLLNLRDYGFAVGRHHQCAVTGASHFRNRSTGCSVQERQANSSMGFTKVDATAITVTIDGRHGHGPLDMRPDRPRLRISLMKTQGHGVIINVIGNAADTHDPEYICGVTGNAALAALFEGRVPSPASLRA
jgi:cytosine/creatinine deaminase